MQPHAYVSSSKGLRSNCASIVAFRTDRASFICDDLAPCVSGCLLALVCAVSRARALPRGGAGAPVCVFSVSYDMMAGCAGHPLDACATSDGAADVAASYDWVLAM